jgi:hypothetical protein
VRRKKIKKSFFDKVKEFVRHPIKYFNQAADDENPFARAIKKIGYAMFDGDARADEFSGPDFDLEEINRAYNTDSYVRQAIDKHIELMFKAGFHFVGKDENVKDYINKRFSILSDMMGLPMNQFWKDIADSLVKHHNVFIVKKRMDPSKMPKVNGLTYKGLGKKKPVGAYFILPAETMKIKVDINGTIKKYQQDNGEEQVEFNPMDVIHIPYKKPAGKFFGVPFLVPVIDDVKLLRQVEDNVARLLYRFLYPLFIYKVGLDKAGYESTDEEIQKMQQEIRNMPIDGGLVLPERHNVELLNTNGSIPAEKYLEYYEKRVFTGLGVSQTLMGRADTSNRSTAENQSSEMRDRVRAFQTVIEDYVNHFIIRELLLEGGYDPLLNPDHDVDFEFEEIDADLKIKTQNHAVYMFEHNAWTHEEMRKALGKEPVADESRLQSNMFNNLENQADTDNKNQPQNQHSNAESENKVDIYYPYESRIKRLYIDFKEKFIEAEELEALKSITEQFFQKSLFYVRNSVRKSFSSGFEEYSDFDFEESKNLQELVEAVEVKLNSLKNEFIEKLRNLDEGDKKIFLKSFESEFSKGFNIQNNEAYNTGAIEAFKGSKEKLDISFKKGENIELDVDENMPNTVPQYRIENIKPLKERGEASEEA